MSTARSARQTPDWWLFFLKFCRQGTRVGSVVPSSSWYARRMVEDIDWSRARCVVELGAGTGAITFELLRQAPSSCRCLIVERDVDFCGRLGERFPAAEIVHGDACHLPQILRERQVATVDHVLCGLALPWFTPADRHRVLDACRRCLTPAGTFRQMTYMPWLHTATYRRYFGAVGFRWVVLNVPPGGYYLCRTPKDSCAPA
jgi:phospholipid N-methyltransferase